MARFNGNVRGGSLALRQSASTGSSRLTSIPNGTALQLDTCSAHDWFYTTYNGQSGYVVAQYIAITNDGGTCTVDNSGRLNIRKTPSSSATSIYQAAAGTQLRLLDNTTVSGWWRVSSSEGTGWAVSSYLELGIAPGSSGGAFDENDEEQVFAVQQLLSNKHYSYGYGDGIFDERTKWAVKYFQQRNGLTPDGVVGSATMAMLNNPDAAKGVGNAVLNRTNGGPAVTDIKMGNSLWSNVVWDAENTTTVETIGSSGNAPTAIAIMLSTLYKRAFTPPVVANWAKIASLRDENGNTGVTAEFFPRAASEWMLAYDGNSTNLSIADMQQYIAQGGLMIARLTSQGAGSAYTGGATYVVIYNVDSEGVHLVNSNAASNATISTAAWNAGRGTWIHEVHKYQLRD